MAISVVLKEKMGAMFRSEEEFFMTLSALCLLVPGSEWVPFIDQQPEVQLGEVQVAEFQGDSRLLWTLIMMSLVVYGELGERAKVARSATLRDRSEAHLAVASELVSRYQSVGQFLSALEDLLYRRLACLCGLSQDLHVAIRKSDGRLVVVTYVGQYRKPGDIMVSPDLELCGL